MHSIRTRLLLFTIPIILLMVVVLGTLIIVNTREKYIEAQRQQALRLISSVASSVKQDVYEFDTSAMNQLLAGFNEIDDVRDIYVLGPDRRVITNGKLDNPYRGEHLGALADPAIYEATEIIYGTNVRGVWAGGPIYLVGDYHVGYIYAEFSLSGVDQRISEIIEHDLVVFGGASLIALMMAVVFANRFTAPVRRLTEAAKQIAAGNEDVQIEVEGRSEVADLARAFKVMVENLQASSRELSNLAASLDSRVKKQTKQLEDANQELTTMIKNLNDTQQQLVSAAKMESLGTLAGGIAHEINTPVQFVADNTNFLKQAFDELSVAIKAMSENVSTAQSGKEIEDLLNEVPLAIEQSLEGLGHIREIVLAVKDFSHPHGKNKAPTDLNQTIANTLTVARNQWRHVAELETDFETGLPPVTCHAGEINQVILNLIVNSAQAIEKKKDEGKGFIKVTTRQSGQYAEITIRDSGCGIAQDHLERIFEPFFTTKEVGKGTGQGLALAHSIVTKNHKGEIRVSSKPGEGTTMTIRLPFGQESLSQPAA